MSYAIRLAAGAKRTLERRLPERVAAAIIEFIYGPLAENPHRAGKPLRDELAGRHVARRGTYRIIYRINDREVTVEVIKIDHRRDIYH